MFIHVLGTAQDGGYPQIGCNDVCCNLAWKDPELKKSFQNINQANQKAMDIIRKKYPHLKDS